MHWTVPARDIYDIAIGHLIIVYIAQNQQMSGDFFVPMSKFVENQFQSIWLDVSVQVVWNNPDHE